MAIFLGKYAIVSDIFINFAALYYSYLNIIKKK